MIWLLALSLVVLLAVLPGPVAVVLAWAALGYVLWRAWPSVRSDVAGLRGARLAVRPTSRSRRGSHL